MTNYGHIVLADSKKEWIAQAIKWFTKSKWSHSLLTIAPEADREMGIEAASNGISAVPFDTSYRNNDTQGYNMYRVLVDDNIKDAAIRICLNDLESAYGYLEYPWFIWRSINAFFGRDIKSQNNWFNQGEVCSQLCVKYLTACNLGQIFSGYGKNSVTPQDLQVIMGANPQYFELIETKE